MYSEDRKKQVTSYKTTKYCCCMFHNIQSKSFYAERFCPRAFVHPEFCQLVREMTIQKLEFKTWPCNDGWTCSDELYLPLPRNNKMAIPLFKLNEQAFIPVPSEQATSPNQSCLKVMRRIYTTLPNHHQVVKPKLITTSPKWHQCDDICENCETWRSNPVTYT